MTKTKKFDWTGACGICSGPSNRYSFTTAAGRRPSRTTLTLNQTILMPDGTRRRFRNERVEICNRCKSRWYRNGDFRARRGPVINHEMIMRAKKMKQSGVRVAEIARTLGRPDSTIRSWLSASTSKHPSSAKS